MDSKDLLAVSFGVLVFFGPPATGFVLSMTGVVLLHQKACDGNPEDAFLCDLYGFQWWVLAFEALVLVLVVFLVYIPRDPDGWEFLPHAVVGLLLFACMQIDQAGWITWKNANQWSRERNLVAAGFTILFVVNIVLAGLWGCALVEDRVLKEEEVPGALRAVGLVLAGVGISGVGMVAKVVADTCEVACEDNWWFLALHLLALLLFIVTQVVFKAQKFRPVLTVLLSFQIRRFEISVDDTDEPLGKVGLLLTIISAYLLIIMFMMSELRSFSDSKEVNICLGVLPVLGVLVGLIVSYADLDFAILLPSSKWIIASQVMTLIFGIMYLIPGDNILDNVYLPLVAFMAMAIYQSPSWTHAWLTKSESDLKITGVGNLILTVSFLLFMIVVDVVWD